MAKGWSLCEASDAFEGIYAALGSLATDAEAMMDELERERDGAIADRTQVISARVCLNREGGALRDA